MSESLEVKKRTETGTRPVMKLRSAGYVPAILYGHGEENVCLSVHKDAVATLIDHGSKLVKLTGEVVDTAILREVQWDSLGSDIIHLDFARVSNTEKVEMTVPVELHGEAVGTNNGGILNFSLHELTISCPANQIPEKIEVDISALNVNDSIHVSDLSLGGDIEIMVPETEIIVSVVEPKRGGAAAGDEETVDGSEPEVISKGSGEEGEAASS
jgi:large subunit ribosomal protein L25